MHLHNVLNYWIIIHLPPTLQHLNSTLCLRLYCDSQFVFNLFCRMRFCRAASSILLYAFLTTKASVPSPYSHTAALPD